MARKSIYNKITTKEKIDNICKFNTDLINDYLEYLASVDRAASTIEQYKADLNIFFCWNLQHNKNKEFTKITKREISKFQSNAINTWDWSPKRIRRVKSTLSSLSNFIENILDEEEEFEGFKKIVNKIESPVNEFVREKTVATTDELQNLLDYLVENKDYQQACFVALAMFSGRRKSELTRIKVSYFTDECVVFGSMYKSPEKVKCKGRGSNGKPTYIYVLKKQFDPYLKLWLDERERLGIESEWLLLNKKNNVYLDQQMPISTINSWCNKFSRILGKDVYAHMFRHYFTTSLSQEYGLPDSVIKTIQNWGSVDMVNVYKDINDDDEIGKYFTEDGIVKVEQKGLSDL